MFCKTQKRSKKGSKRAKKAQKRKPHASHGKTNGWMGLFQKIRAGLFAVDFGANPARQNHQLKGKEGTGGHGEGPLWGETIQKIVEQGRPYKIQQNSAQTGQKGEEQFMVCCLLAVRFILSTFPDSLRWWGRWWISAQSVRLPAPARRRRSCQGPRSSSPSYQGPARR